MIRLKQHLHDLIITVLVENSILLFFSSRRSRLGGKSRKFFRVYPGTDGNHLVLHFSPRTRNSEGGNPSTCGISLFGYLAILHLWLDIWEQTLLIHFIRMHLLFVVTIIYLATAWHIRLPHLQMYSESLMRLLWQWGWNNERLMRIIQMIISERACWYIVGLANISQSKPCLIEPISHLGQPLSPPAHPLGKGNVQLCKLHVTTMSSRKCALHISKEGQNWIFFLPKSRQPYPFNTKKSPDTPWEKQALWWWPSC